MARRDADAQVRHDPGFVATKTKTPRRTSRRDVSWASGGRSAPAACG